ncbi:MAG: class I SAM-dependent methyltransferase [Burkholderiaceae bacterium]
MTTLETSVAHETAPLWFVVAFRAMKERASDYRSMACRNAEQRVIALCAGGSRVLGLGGGPFRVHPRIVNLNIAKLAEVDVIGDAHRLPFADNSFDAAHCEAVFEHLPDPHIAAAELHRVLRPGAIGYICTPFMQAFHGYPSHYQNFTCEGHKRLFERAGFQIKDAGAATGPAWALCANVSTFIATYSPKYLRLVLRAVWHVMAKPIRMLDLRLSEHRNAAIAASSTYVLIEKR